MALRVEIDGSTVLVRMTGRSKSLISSLTAAEAREVARHLYSAAETLDPPQAKQSFGRVIGCGAAPGLKAAE